MITQEIPFKNLLNLNAVPVKLAHNYEDNV